MAKLTYSLPCTNCDGSGEDYEGRCCDACDSSGNARCDTTRPVKRGAIVKWVQCPQDAVERVGDYGYCLDCVEEHDAVQAAKKRKAA